MATPFDPDQLLALALTPMQRRHLKLVRTPEETLAAARRARAHAVRTRQKLRGSRGRFAATLARTRELHARLAEPGDDL